MPVIELEEVTMIEASDEALEATVARREIYSVKSAYPCGGC
jgi:hypothetical protein